MGGNSRLNDYLANYDLYMDNTAKYSSPAACHYRKHILEKNIPPMVEDFVLVDEEEHVGTADDLLASQILM